MPVQVWVGLGIVNSLGFILMGLDKRQAKGGRQRVRERTLFGLAIAFGAIGVYLGLKCFRHKTRHPSFTITLPLLIIIQSAFLHFLQGRL